MTVNIFINKRVIFWHPYRLGLFSPDFRRASTTTAEPVQQRQTSSQLEIVGCLLRDGAKIVRVAGYSFNKEFRFLLQI